MLYAGPWNMRFLELADVLERDRATVLALVGRDRHAERERLLDARRPRAGMRRKAERSAATYVRRGYGGAAPPSHFLLAGVRS